MARVLRACLLLLAAGVAAPLSLVLVLRWVPPPTSAFMLRDALAATDTAGSARTPYRWTSWDGIAPYAALAVIASEDQKFPDHNGFDVEAIRMALGDALQGGRLRGASTISQQTAKNLFLWPGRSLFRKGLEAYLTVLIELCWSKRRIVEGVPQRRRIRRGRFRHHRGQRTVLRQAAGRARRGRGGAAGGSPAHAVAVARRRSVGPNAGASGLDPRTDDPAGAVSG